MSEHLEAAAVRIGAEDAAFVREGELISFRRGHGDAFVPDCPVDFAVRPQGEAMHVVPGVGDMVAEAMGEDFALVGRAVAVGVAQLPDVGRDRGVDGALVPENASGDAGDFGLEAIGVELHGVRGAIAIGVFDTVEFLADHAKVAVVVRSVPVEILDAGGVFRGTLRGEAFPVKGELVLDTAESDVVGDPVEVLADIEVLDLAALGLGDIGPSLVIQADGDGVWHVEVARPLVEGKRSGFGGGRFRKEHRGLPLDLGAFDANVVPLP